MNEALPQYLYTAEQVRRMDAYAIQTLRIPGMSLMQKAGEVAFADIRHNWPRIDHITVVCGAGNNGGDGYVVARLALQRGLKVQLLALTAKHRLKGDALLACESFQGSGGVLSEFNENSEFEGALIVDGLLGTGLDREVSGLYRSAIKRINQFDGVKLALDIPSGIRADTGTPLGIAVRADRTVCFIGLKQGLFTGYGPEHCGRVSYSSLGVPDSVLSSEKPSAEFVDGRAGKLGARSRSAHKGDFGHLLVIGGDRGYIGAARLAAEAGARVGAGLVSVATRQEHASVLNLTRAEIMCRGAESASDLVPLLNRATVAAIGPGLGRSAWALEMLKAVLDTELPVVIDADALNILADRPLASSRWILTPHPGEAARLLKEPTGRIQDDRFTAAAAIQKKYGGVCVLKGSGSIVVEAGRVPAICGKGNPGMASGGMGDVLTGIIGGLLAQGLSLGDAARVGTFVHGAAADEAAKAGERGLLAGDLMDHLRALVNF